jgi:hypothetical protein
MVRPPSIVDIQSWLLRCLYLRATGHPHAVHMCSCIVMHLVEAVGLHQESSNVALHQTVDESYISPEKKRRTFWIARMFNTWVSFECGRTRVALRGITAQPPAEEEGDFTSDYVKLYSLSCFLDPDISDDQNQLEGPLRQLEAFEARHDSIELSRANIALCGYRRLRLVNPNLPTEITNKIINMCLRGLEAAQRMARKGLPWW